MAVDPWTFLVALREILKNETSAADRIFPGTGPVTSAARPQITLQENGAIPVPYWTRMERMRVRIDCYGRGDEEARKLYGEIRDILLPPETPSHGYYGAVTVTVDGTPRTINFSGVELNAGPDALTDLPSGFTFTQSYWLCPYF